MDERKPRRSPELDSCAEEKKREKDEFITFRHLEQGGGKKETNKEKQNNARRTDKNINKNKIVKNNALWVNIIHPCSDTHTYQPAGGTHSPCMNDHLTHSSVWA